MVALEFVLLVEPVAQQRPRFSKWGTYKSQTQQAHDAEMDCQLFMYAPESPLEGAVSVEFTAFMPVPRSTSKSVLKRILERITPHTKKQDVDNLAKQLLDRMTALHFWHDDGQVWQLVARKVYSDKPRWEVRVEEWQDGL
jgi:Holliday junction resolvase RusA-like endonuclease